jgi:homopolymeric O-antigen transport system permease protein
MISSIQQLFFRRDLIWSWAYRIVRARYQQSLLGGLWAIIQPAATVIIFSVIFTIFVPVNTQGIPYMVFSYVAMVPWTLFSSSFSDMADSLVGNMNLVSKIYFPREILPISSMLARLVDFTIAFCVIIILIIYFQMKVYILGWLFLPVILLIQILLALGLGLLGAALNVFYRDVRHLIALGLQLWFYASPIIYPVSTVKDHLGAYYSLYFLNPMAGVLEAYRSVILYQQLPGSYIFLSSGVALLLFLIGYWFFKRVEFQFADVI